MHNLSQTGSPTADHSGMAGSVENYCHQLLGHILSHQFYSIQWENYFDNLQNISIYGVEDFFQTGFPTTDHSCMPI